MLPFRKQLSQSNTKRGPGRKHKQGSDEPKTLKQRAAGSYGRGLANHFNRKRQRELAKRYRLRDAHGAFTLTGGQVEFVDIQPDSRYHPLGGSSGPDGFTVDARRIWLAGISAQRGY